MDHTIVIRGGLPPASRVTVSPTYLMISGGCVKTTGKKKEVNVATESLLTCRR